MTKYIRKQKVVDAVEMPVDGTFGSEVFRAGDFILTCEDGSKAILDPETFHDNYELEMEYQDSSAMKMARAVADNDISEGDMVHVSPTPVTPVVPPAPVAKDNMYTCLICSQDVPKNKFDKGSGICIDCIKVKCRTCGATHPFSKIRGDYCPSCLKPVSV